MMDTSTDVFDFVVSVYVDTARYIWCRAGISVHFPLGYSVAKRRSRSTCVTRFNVVVDCSRTWIGEPNICDFTPRPHGRRQLHTRRRSPFPQPERRKNL